MEAGLHTTKTVSSEALRMVIAPPLSRPARSVYRSSTSGRVKSLDFVKRGSSLGLSGEGEVDEGADGDAGCAFDEEARLCRTACGSGDV